MEKAAGRGRWKLAAGQPAGCVRGYAVKTLHLTVLTGFALAQPIFSRVGERPAFLEDSHVTGLGILSFAAFLSLVIPLLVAALLRVVAWCIPQAGEPLYRIAVFVLFSIIALPVVKRIEILPAFLAIVGGLGVGAAATAAYFHSRWMRSVVTAAAPAVIVFPALFLCHSPVARRFFFAAQKIETATGQPVPVVLVIFDELCGMSLADERREIDAERFPHFAELAGQSIWFRNATTVYPDTWQALPAIFSGKYPSTSYAPTAVDLPQNLFTLLEATGKYGPPAVFEPVSAIAEEANLADGSSESDLFTQAAAITPTLGCVFLAHLMPASLQEDLPAVPRLWFGVHDSKNVNREMTRGVFRYKWGEDRVGQFSHFLRCLEDSPVPALRVFHVLLPHIPWCYLPSGRKYIAESDSPELLDLSRINGISEFWGTDENYVAQGQQRYLLQLQFTDSLLGRLLNRLRESGLYDKCLLIVTADHGISFKSGDSRRTTSPANLVDVMSIPLFIKIPGQKVGSINDQNVESIDILPTIADIAGIDLALPVDGHSVFDVKAWQRDEKRIFHRDIPTIVAPTIVGDSTVPAEISRRFGRASDAEALYRIGPHPELIGRRVADLPASGSPALEIAVNYSRAVYHRDADDLVPCFIEGRIGAPHRGPGPVAIAVAVNGTIRAVTQTYLLDGFRDRFSVLVPEWAFGEGENEFQFFTVEGTTPDLRLIRCTVRINAPPRRTGLRSAPRFPPLQIQDAAVRSDLNTAVALRAAPMILVASA